MIAPTDAPPINTENRHPESARPPGVHLPFLDGMRGLSALYVVLFHLSSMYLSRYGMGADMPSFLRKTAIAAHYGFFNYGHLAVVVFIVLSGYCLMLPVARAEGEMRGGWRVFLLRRSWRILPPYYAALAFALALAVLIPGMNTPWHRSWDISLPALDAGAILSHLLLIHNWTPWALRINPTLWTVPVEWQIYFAFPFLLLPLWKRAGSLVMMLTSLVLGLLPKYICPPGYTGAAPHFLALFAVGMAAAAYGFSIRCEKKRKASFLRWDWLAIAFFSPVVLSGLIQRQSLLHFAWVRAILRVTWGPEWPIDVLTGCAAACLIVYCAQWKPKAANSKPPVVLRLLQSRIALRLGAFSYSLYLIHSPVLWTVDLVTRRWNLSAIPGLIADWGVGLPLALAASYLFYLSIERRFLSGKLWSSGMRERRT